MPLPKRLTLCLILALCVSVVSAGDVYKAPDPEPTPEETLILEYMNRMRADPHADCDRILRMAKQMSSWMTRDVDLKMFKKEMYQLSPKPPLVMNLRLLDAARKHSHYMIKNGLGHSEKKGKAGFTGKSFGERCKAAGYKGFPAGENAFASAPGPWGSHMGFVIDKGPGGTGGMQPGRGHRRNMMAGHREIGCSGLPHAGGRGGRLSVTHNFGSRRVPRLAGGVIYIDRNQNDFYDVGEGIGGVRIAASDGATTTSWKSGGFALDLKSTQSVTISAKYSGRTFAKTFKPGKENLKFDWIVKEDPDSKKADRLLGKVDGGSGKEAPRQSGAVLTGAKETAGKAPSDTVVKTWDDRLLKRLQQKITTKKTPRFMMKSIKQEVKIVAAKSNGALVINNAGLEVPWQYGKLSREDRKNLAVAMAREKAPEDAALAAFYLLLLKHTDSAQKYVLTAGPAGAEVEKLFK